MKIISLLSVTLFSILLGLEAQAISKHKVVFLHGSRSHASGDHEFQAGSHLLAKHLNVQKKVNIEAVVNAGWPEDDSILDDADAIVIYADGTKVIGHGWEKMDELVNKKKVGVIFMHYAVHPSVEQGEKYFLPWIGGLLQKWSFSQSLLAGKN